MKTRAILTLATSLGMILLAPGGAARAQGPGGGPPLEPGRPEAMEHRMAMRHHRMEMTQELDLSKEQRETIAELREKQERTAIRMRADLQTAQLDLRHLMRVERPDRMAVHRQIDRIAQLRAEMQKARIGLRLDIRGLLTPEQRERMREPGGS